MLRTADKAAFGHDATLEAAQNETAIRRICYQIRAKKKALTSKSPAND